MKILVTSIVDLKSSQHNRPHQFVRYLSKKHDVTVLSINDWWKAKQGDLKSYSSDFDEVFKRINIIHLTDRKVSPILQEILSLKKVDEIVKEEFDVHLNYSTLSSGYVAARKISTVYDIADDLGAMIRASPQIPRIIRPLGGAVGDILIKKNIDTSKVVTVTTDTLFKSYNIPKSKSKIVPNGVDTELFRDYGSIKREELGLDGFIIGYVGVLREWVDLAPVFAALKNLDTSIKMLVVGKEGRFKEHVNLAKKYGLKDRVIFTGMVPYSQVPKFISAMDACLIPFSRNAISENALPLKLFEYMACSKPVISTVLPGVKKVIGDNIIYTNSVEDYRSAISQLYDNPELIDAMGISGRQFVETGYDWAKIVSNLEEILLKSASG